MLLPWLLWLGILVLSLGFCGVFGALIRRARRGSGLAHAQVALFGALVILPSAAIVLGQPGPTLPARLAILLAGVLVVAAVHAQPTWAPDVLWSRPFARAYFGAAMGVTALWELGLALTSASIAPSLLAAAAGVAGAASLATARRPARA
jgi:hypothetical protein